MAWGDYVVKTFSWNKERGFSAFAEVNFRTRKDAIGRAYSRQIGERGAIAYKKEQNRKTGAWEAVVLARYGDVPNDLSPYFQG